MNKNLQNLVLFIEINSDTLIKVVIVGNCNVGKSCILMRYSENYFTSQYYNTIGVDFKTRVIKIRNQDVKLQIWDTAGQEKFKALTNNYYRDAHGVVIVYDVSERYTFDAVDSWIEDMDKFGRKSVQKLIVGNKADVPNKRKISIQESQEKARQFNAQFIEVSAKTSENVDRLFISICEQVIIQRVTALQLEQQFEQITIELIPEQQRMLLKQLFNYFLIIIFMYKTRLLD